MGRGTSKVQMQEEKVDGGQSIASDDNNSTTRLENGSVEYYNNQQNTDIPVENGTRKGHMWTTKMDVHYNNDIQHQLHGDDSQIKCRSKVVAVHDVLDGDRSFRGMTCTGISSHDPFTTTTHIETHKKNMTTSVHDREVSQAEITENISSHTDQLMNTVHGRNTLSPIDQVVATQENITTQAKTGKKKKKKKKNQFQSLRDVINQEQPEQQAMVSVDDKYNDTETVALKEQKLLSQIKAMTSKTRRLEALCTYGDRVLTVEDENECVCPEIFLDSINLIQRHLAAINRENSRLRSENDEYLNRLSTEAGIRLTSNNPNITNLNDPNRPGKIAELFNEIYDNDWTDALQDLQIKKKRKKHDNKDDRLYVYHLYSLIKVIYKSCKQKAERQIHGLAENMFLMNNPSTEQVADVWQSYPTQRQKINEGRKFMANEAIEMLQQTLKEDAIFHNEVRCCNPPLDDTILTDLLKHEYFNKCVELCWKIVIQDPPMYLETIPLEGTQIDKDSYKLYTNSGCEVEYIVWPALYLHNQGFKGPVMAKGVVQTVKLVFS